MKKLEMIQKLAILHCVYQMIASADGNIDEKRDSGAIEYALSELGFSSVYSWDSATQLNPTDCFIHISLLTDNVKQSFQTLLLTIANMGGNTLFRINCAKHIFQLCQV